MKYRKLDANGDYLFGGSGEFFVDSPDAVRQAIQTRLLLLTREWFLDAQEGTPYDPDIVRGTVIDHAELDRQIELYRSQPADARRSIVGLQPKRADVILAGALIVRTVLDKLDVASLTVTDRGLRDGVLFERFGA